MIKTDFEWCSVYAPHDVKVTGVRLLLDDTKDNFLRVSGELDFERVVGTDVEVYLTVANKRYGLVFSEVESIGSLVTGYFTGVFVKAGRAL